MTAIPDRNLAQLLKDVRQQGDTLAINIGFGPGAYRRIKEVGQDFVTVEVNDITRGDLVVPFGQIRGIHLGKPSQAGLAKTARVEGGLAGKLNPDIKGEA